MESRLIILPRLAATKTRWGDAGGSAYRLTDVWRDLQAGDFGKSGSPLNAKGNREEGLRSNQLAYAILPRKTSSELRATVPKPTQVGEASSLRRSG